MTKDAELTKAIYRKTPVLIQENEPKTNPWNLDIYRMLHGSGDSACFKSERTDSQSQRVYEAKCFHQFNHRFATWAGDYTHSSPADLLNPSWTISTQFWVDPAELPPTIRTKLRRWYACYRVIGRATDERTIISCILPTCSVVYSANVLEGIDATDATLLLGILNSFSLDYFARQSVGGANIQKFVVQQLPVPSPTHITLHHLCAGSGRLPHRTSLELSYAAWDLEPFAIDCGYDGPPFRWDEERRFLLRCEQDAACFHFYLGPPEDWGANSQELVAMFPTPRDAVDYIMETFPIVRRKDEQAHGEYRTKRIILEIYDAMAEAIRTGQHYQTRLDPPPGPPTDAAGNFIPMAQWDPNHWPSHIHPPRTAPAPQRVAAVIEPAFPRTPLDKVLCACLLEAVQLQPGLTEDQYVDNIVLSMQSARCRLLLTGNDRKKFDRAVKSAPPELVADADAHPPWPSLLKCLLANQSLSRSERALVMGNNFEAVRATLPAIDNQFAGLVAKAAERLRELQEAAAPDVATVTVVEELKSQHAAAMAETRG